MLDNDDTIGKSERPSLYKTQRWRQLRQRRLTVEPHCRMCAKMGLRERAVIVDHIKPGRVIWFCSICTPTLNHSVSCTMMVLRNQMNTLDMIKPWVLMVGL